MNFIFVTLTKDLYNISIIFFQFSIKLLSLETQSQLQSSSTGTNRLLHCPVVSVALKNGTKSKPK